MQASRPVRPAARFSSVPPSSLAVPADQPDGERRPLGSGGEGWFAYEGWLLGGVRESGKADQFASAHESHHKQLADSTAFGLLCRALRQLESTEAARRARAFNRTTAPVQEAFASWTPATAIGWTRNDLYAAYPAYAGHWDVMDRITSLAPSPYLAVHAAHASARASMQAPVIDIALQVGLRDLELADIPRRLRPDHRFATLQRHPIDWKALVARIDAALVADPRWAELQSARSLSAEMFSSPVRTIWATVNDTVYAAFAEILDANHCPTLTNEGHHGELRSLLAAAAEDALPLTLTMADPPAIDRTTLVVLANAESETYVSGPLGPAQLLPTDITIDHMVTGPVSPHLLLCLRQGASTARNFDFADRRGPDVGSSRAHLRRGELDDAGEFRVSLLDVADQPPSALLREDVPTYSIVDLSRFDTELVRRWDGLISSQRTALVIDVPLAENLPVWLANEDATLRYAFIRTQPQGRIVTFLLATISLPDVHSHLMLRAMSPATVRVLRAAFDELSQQGMQITQDNTVVERYEPMLGIVLAHLAIEERVFGIL